MQLHLGVPLSPDDARTMIGIAERQPDGDVRDATIGLLAHEVIFTTPSRAARSPQISPTPTSTAKPHEHRSVLWLLVPASQADSF
jgi:hypothetical protein